MSDSIDDILRREGGAVHDPLDKGGRTQYGISEASNPEAWADGRVTSEEARSIYLEKYVEGPGFNRITNRLLREFLIDWGVNSGPTLVIIELQKILQIATDGVIGPLTLSVLESIDATQVLHQLIGARLRMFGRIVQKDPTQVKFIVGWINRVLEFLV